MPPTTAPGTRASGLQDVSLGVAFNPATAAAYRLIGYDGPDARSPSPPALQDIQPAASESIAPGRSLTVLYEVVPADETNPGTSAATATPRRPLSAPNC